jgi:hypothetical protein
MAVAHAWSGVVRRTTRTEISGNSLEKYSLLTFLWTSFDDLQIRSCVRCAGNIGVSSMYKSMYNEALFLENKDWA